MQKDQFKILIVDDDATFGKACVKLVERLGYQPHLAKNPDDARQMLLNTNYQCLLVDCMLPRIPGVEFIQEAAKISPDSVLILMSGIYKDSGFVRQAKQKSGTSNFLVKPFTGDQLEAILSTNFEGFVEERKDPVPRLFSTKSIRKRKILEAIEESDTIHGFELPFIYSLFFNAGISGQMNIVEAEGDIFGVTYSNGKIVGVETNDPPTQVGEILGEKDYVDREDIEAEMARESELRIGERLIAANLVSPHIIDEILVEQMEIRLTKTVMDSSIEVNFVEADEIPDSAGIEAHNFAFLLSRWMDQKITPSWLKSYYLPWMDHSIKEGAYFSDDAEVLSSSAFINKPNFAKELAIAGTISNMLAQQLYPEDDVFACIHLLAISKFIHFDQVAQTKDFVVHMQRLRKLHKDIREKNHFEVLNLSKNARDSEIKRAYSEFEKILAPDRLGDDAPVELVELNNSILEIVNKSYEVLSSQEGREEYLKELRDLEARQVLQAEAIIEHGKNALSSGNARQALEHFNEALQMNKDNQELIGYRIWARLKLLPPANKTEELQQIERDLSEYPQESRQSALFHFIKGLFQKEKGNFQKARSLIENAVSMKPDFLEARRELNMLKLKQQDDDKPVDILRGDLKDVVGMLFKRKGK